MITHLRLPDGTAWPDPDSEAFADACWAAQYGAPTRSQQLLLASIASAYHHLARHPDIGTESVIKQLRMLRRAKG